MNLRWTKSLFGRRDQALAGRPGGAGCAGVRRYSVGGGWLGRSGVVIFNLVLVFATTGLSASAVLAQDTNYTSAEVTAGKPFELSYHASAHKSNCSAGALPTIRVLEAPKSGTLTVRKAVLTTNKIIGCPSLKTPAQVVFDLANAGYAGPDHVKYEVTSESGEVATYDVTITVKAAAPQSPPAGAAKGQPL